MSSYVQLDDFVPSENGQLNVEIVMSDYIVSGPSRQEEIVSRLRDGVSTPTLKGYYYTFKIKQNMHVKLVSPIGETLYDEVYDGRAKNYKTVSKIPREWDSYVNQQFGSFFNKKKKEYSIQLLKKINKDLNFEFGYSVASNRIHVYSGVGKKHDYSDHELAQKRAIRAYNELIIEPEVSKENLLLCIKEWTSEIGIANVSDKKSKVNTRVKAGLLLNIATAQIMLEQFKEASMILDDLDFNDNYPNSIKLDAEEIRKFLYQQKRRRKAVESILNG